MMRRIVYGEVLAPDVVDAQGDVVREAEIERAAHRFLADGGLVGAMHRRFEGVGRVVESFVARPGDADFTPGAWVLGVQLSEEAWRAVQEGTLTGFSIGGRAVRVPREEATEEGEGDDERAEGDRGGRGVAGGPPGDGEAVRAVQACGLSAPGAGRK